MKKYFVWAAAALLLAACSSDDSIVADQNLPGQTPENGAVAFDAYMGRATTRAGKPGDLTNAVMQGTNAAVGDGFGVFGYYTDNNDYDQLAVPNFMWNQKVKANFAAATPYAFTFWSYEPVKYWPNEYGNNAISDDNDKVSFFAYAPYVAVETTGKLSAADIAAGKDKWGITAMTRNTNSGDPIIKYIASFDKDKAVDLCWGVCQNSDWQLVQTGQAQTMALGKPWLNVQRPADATALGATAGQKVKFQFKHATAKMHIDINAFVDGYDNTNPLNDATRIYVRSVRFTGFTMQGALNLNNETPNKPYWMNYNGIGDLVADGDVIVYDGRKDGKEGVSGAVATNEKVTGLNPQLIQDENQISGSAWVATGTGYRTGVQKDDGAATPKAQELFENGGIFYVIPTGDPMTIEIEYDVETINTQLGTTLSDSKTPGSSVPNKISKSIVFGADNNTLEAGKAYDIHLHLGMNSVKFDADVVDWEDMADPDIDLPANMPAYKAATTTGKLEIPAEATTATFAIYGLKGGEVVASITSNFFSKISALDWNSTGDLTATGDKRANASGVVYVKATTTANTTVQDIKKNTDATPADIKITATGALTTTATEIAFVQKAAKLGMAKPASLAAAATTCVLTRSVLGSTAWSETNTNCPALVAYSGTSLPTEKYIRVWRNGAELTRADTPTTAAQFGFNNTNGTITFASGAALANGDEIKVTIQPGAGLPEETISFTVPITTP